MSGYHRSLFIFRRDLRLADNSALNAALNSSKQVIPCFILDPQQINSHPYQSKAALQFMLQAISDLQQALVNINTSLALFHGSPLEVIQRLVSEQGVQAVYINRDYTPFSLRRDAAIRALCLSLKIDCHIEADYLLTEPEQALKADGRPYKVFTAFYQHVRQFRVFKPQPLVGQNFVDLQETVALGSFYPAAINAVPGGRQAALAILENLKLYQHYLAERDIPALTATTQLSPHLKFGTCSVREVFQAISHQLGAEHPLLRQLYWRDFFTHIAYHFPQVFGQAFLAKFSQLTWDNDQTDFQAWAAGRTGFPIVDAGMRELNSTGFMHNRVRMVVASFLVKDLHISWRWGERYFAQHLVDYDPCVNNGNWQWAASTGCDAQPYFRIFNPWLQQQKFDPDCAYIYRWIPELQGIPVKTIQQWDKKHVPCAYPAPMLNHAEAVKITKARYQAAAQS